MELKRRYGERLRDAETKDVLAQLAMTRRDRMRRDVVPEPQPTREPGRMSPVAKGVVIALTVLIFLWLFVELGS